MPHYVDNKSFTNALIEYRKAKRKWQKGDNGNPPPISDYIGRCIMQICTGLGSKPNFSGYCVDEQTQALTKRGWLSHDEITTDDIILAMDIKTKKLVWSKIFNIYRQSYKGPMFRITGSTMDALVTPGHKFLTEKRGLCPIEDIDVKDHIITMGLPLETSLEVYSDDFVRLVGWFVTEGCIAKYQQKRTGDMSYYITIFQSKKVNPENCEEISEIIKQLTPHDMTWIRKEHKTYNDGGTSFQCNRELSKKMIEVAPEKVMTFDFIFSLSHRQRLILLKTMLKAERGGENQKQYFQVDKRRSENFALLAALSGYNTHVAFRAWETAFGHCQGYDVTISSRDRCCVEAMNFYGGKRTSGGNWKIKKHMPTFAYDGIVWCPTTEHGTFVCRRGPRIYVTGNSFLSDMLSDGIEKCVAAVDNFNPRKSRNAFAYFTMVAFRAFLYRIEKESFQVYTKLKNYERLHVLDVIMHNDAAARSGEDSNQKINTIFTDDFIQRFEEKMARKKLPRKKNK